MTKINAAGTQGNRKGLQILHGPALMQGVKVVGIVWRMPVVDPGRKLVGHGDIDGLRKHCRSVDPGLLRTVSGIAHQSSTVLGV